MPPKNHPTNASRDGRYMVPIIRSTFEILNQLNRNGAQSLNEVTRSTALPKSTVFRILSSLSDLGYVLRNGRPPTYYPSPKLGELSRPSSWVESLRQVALQHLLRLRREFGENVNLAQLDLDRVTYLEVVRSEHALDLNERKGEWIYAHASALGKALLAFSPPEAVKSIIGADKLLALTPQTITSPKQLFKELGEVRKRGYAIDCRETNMIANCVAAPILDANGFAVAAVSISGPESRFDPQRNRKVVTALRKAAARISKEFGIASHPLNESGAGANGRRKPSTARV